MGILLASGYGASLVLKRFRIPHIVAYLVVGFTIANTIFADIDMSEEMGTWFATTGTLALGLIGFKIGTELKIQRLAKEPKFIIIVLLAEAGRAFLLVFTVVFLFFAKYLLALLLGGLATATAPTATVEVLRKLGAKGEFTTKSEQCW